MEPMTQFEPGTAVTWLSVPRGGYGYVWPVDGTVVRTTSTRVIIRVTTRTGQQVERAVRPESLRSRAEPADRATPAWLRSAPLRSPASSDPQWVRGEQEERGR